MLTIQPNDGMEKYLCDKAFETGTPISGTFELLPTCNMDCKMCYVRLSPEEMKKQGQPLSAEQWLRIGKEAATKGTMFLLLTGGEPLLHPEFCEIYESLRSLGICVTINTNGTLINSEITNMFHRNLPRRVNVSLYGSNNEVYENLCRNPKGFTQTMQGIQMLLDAGVPVKLNYTLTPQNYHEIDKIVKIAEDLQVPISIPTYMFPPARKQTCHNGTYLNRLSAKETAQAQVEILYRSFHEEDDYILRIQSILENMKSSEKNEEDMIQPPGGLLCTAGVSSYWVNWKGDLTPCGMLKAPMRNLLNESFETGWSQIQEETKRIFTSTKCFNCRYRKSCQTCAASAYAETGDFIKEVPYHCELCAQYENLLQKHLKDLTEG